MTLQRLILTFKPEEVILHVLYRTQDGPGPNTKTRRKEVAGLARGGLEWALEALEGRVDVIGVSGYDVREDALSVASPPAVTKAKRAKGG
jgi:hypothetical protein